MIREANDNSYCRVLQPVPAPVIPRKKADPNNVASIILGGGAGAQLFPLTSRRATPAVNIYLKSLTERFLLRMFDMFFYES